MSGFQETMRLEERGCDGEDDAWEDFCLTEVLAGLLWSFETDGRHVTGRTPSQLFSTFLFA